MKVLAEVKVEEILEYTPQQLWDKTKSEAGISEKDYFKYFMGREKAYAFRLGKIIKYSKPKNLKYFDCKFPPQSFIYLK
jgi:predicted transcriptional regulator